MKIEDKYKKIDEIEHVILRSGMYLGSIEHEKVNIYIPDDNGKMILKNLTIMPSFIKLFDEIVTNSSDESRRKGSKLDTIKINVNSETGEIVVEDNGGIPVVIHSETLEYVPQMIFTNLRAGSNFNDNVSDAVAGTNGLGSKLTAIFSKEFKIETCDGKKSFKMVVKDNMSIKSEPIVNDVKSSKGYTRISYKPDYEKLKMDNIDNDNLLMLKLRAYEIAACNPKLKVFFNDKKIDFKSFKDYIAMYTKNINDIVYIEQEGWRVGITFNDFETQHTSYVNGIRTIVGGTHVDHVLNSLVDVLREKIEKKTKQSIRPSDIRNNIHVFIDCDINNPKFTSQTKEKMINQPSGFDNKFNIDESLAKKILNGDIFKKIIEWAMRKKDIDDLKNIEQRENAVRKSGFYDIPKYRPATSKSRKECSLFLSEGDCLSENTEIHTFNGERELKTVELGDLVLTHKNRYKRVINKISKVKDTLRIYIDEQTYIESSYDHKFLVYVSNLNVYGYVKAKNITTDMKLIKSKILGGFNNYMKVYEISSNDSKKYDTLIRMQDIQSDMKVSQECTGTHKFLIYDVITKEYTMKEASNIEIDHEYIVYSC